MFCKELSPARKEHLMNKAREELHKLQKGRKTEKRQNVADGGDKVDVLSLVKAKKNEISISEGDVKISKQKVKKKKHKSKSKDSVSESNEMNNTLSLGLRVNIELANGSKNSQDITLNPKLLKAALVKHSIQDSSVRMKEKTEKKKEKKVKKKTTEIVKNTSSQKFKEKHKKNPENLEKDLSDENRKDIDTIDELEKTVGSKKQHKKKKSKRESPQPGSDTYPETVELTQNTAKSKKHSDNSIPHVEQRKSKKQKMSTDTSFDMEANHKSERKKLKHKDMQNECTDENTEEKTYKDVLELDSSDLTKKKKKKKSKEASLEDYESRTVKEKKRKSTENMSELLESDSSNLHRTKKKKKKHKDALESSTSFAEVSCGKLEGEEEPATNICDTRVSPTKRKHKKHKIDEDAEVPKKKKKQMDVSVEISNGYLMGHMEDAGEIIAPTEMGKKKKKGKSVEEAAEIPQNKYIEEDELQDSKHNKHKKKKKKEKECKSAEHSSENVLEVNPEESSELAYPKKDKKGKRKHLRNESNDTENVNGEHEGPEEKTKKKKSKRNEKETETTLVYRSETTLVCNGEISCISQNTAVVLKTPTSSKENAIFGRSPMERLLHGDPSTTVNETCSCCAHNIVAHTPPPPPLPAIVNIKQELVRTQQVQAKELTQVQAMVDQLTKAEAMADQPNNMIENIVIKAEPGLETQCNNSEVLEPINFIEMSSIAIKQEPGLETEASTTQPNDPIQLNVQQLENIKQEAIIDHQGNLNSAVYSEVCAPELQQPCLKLEPQVEVQNFTTDTTEANQLNLQQEYLNDTNAYLNNVISTDSGFFRQAPSVEKEAGATPPEPVPSAQTTDTIVSDTDMRIRPWPEPHLGPPIDETALAYRAPTFKEEWVYELHMIDVPPEVNFRQIATYFKVPLSKVMEYHGYSKKTKFKHVVVALSNHILCQRMSKKKRLFGSRYTYMWSFKKYIHTDSR